MDWQAIQMDENIIKPWLVVGLVYQSYGWMSCLNGLQNRSNCITWSWNGQLYSCHLRPIVIK